MNSSPEKIKKGIVSKLGWVPNLFTLGNLWMGFFAIILAFQRSDSSLLPLSGLLILLAALCDGLDGYAARLLNAQSDLGAQLDSLADLTTFGIAPAILMYSQVLKNFDNIGFDFPLGMVLAAIYPACAAYRLARFNVSHVEDAFSGLPSPVAGVIVGLLPIAFQRISVSPYILIFVFILVAFLMVSTLRYAKPQVTIFRKFSPARLSILIVFLIGSLVFIGFRYGADHAAAGLLTLIGVYIVSGLVAYAIHAIQEYRV